MKKRNVDWVIAFVALAWIINSGIGWVIERVSRGAEMPGYVYADYSTSDGRVIKGVPQWTMTDCDTLATQALDPKYSIIVTAPYGIPESDISKGERLRIVGVNCRVSEGVSI